MASVTLRAFFLNAADDPSDYIALEYVGDSFTVSDAIGGGIDHDYASGRSRGWSDESDVTSVAFTATLLSLADIAWLKAHRGQTVTFRDHLGTKVHAQYRTATATLSTLPDSLTPVHEMPLALESVTFSEVA